MTAARIPLSPNQVYDRLLRLIESRPGSTTTELLDTLRLHGRQRQNGRRQLISLALHGAVRSAVNDEHLAEWWAVDAGDGEGGEADEDENDRG